MGENLVNSWRTIGASVRGISHEKHELPCQDAHYFEYLPGNILVAAVADGAGSAVHSHIGSKIATLRAVEEIDAQLDFLGLPEDEQDWSQFWKDVLVGVQNALADKAISCQIPLQDLAATLIVAIATPEFIAAVQVGDGAAVIRDSEGAIWNLTKPQSGEYINETTFLTSSNALDTMQVKMWRGKLAQLALFSDGLQMLALKMPEALPYQPFFYPSVSICVWNSG